MLENGVVTHNTGPYYSASTIWIVGREQDKDDDELQGFHFKIKIEKSRYVREKAVIPITVGFDSGIKRWSGLLDIAVKAKYLVKGKKGNRTVYQRCDPTTGEITGEQMYTDQVDNGPFWEKLLAETDIARWIEDHYSIANKTMEYDED